MGNGASDLIALLAPAKQRVLAHLCLGDLGKLLHRRSTSQPQAISDAATDVGEVLFVELSRIGVVAHLAREFASIFQDILDLALKVLLVVKALRNTSPFHIDHRVPLEEAFSAMRD